MAAREGLFQKTAEVYLQAIDRYNPQTNAVLLKLADLALEQARKADEAEARGEWLGPLHGVPVTIKDCLNVAGYRTTFGSRLYVDHVSNADSAVVARLRRAGAVFLAKTHLTEFCYGATGENPHFGNCNNPWDLARIPGGSSSGPAASVAADMCRIGIGSDTGGSVRVPAALCGVVGLRPTFGCLSNANALPLTVEFDTIGPLAKSVGDVARAFAVMAGFDPEDPASIDRPVENFLPALHDGIAGVRIGMPKRFFFEGLQPEVERAVLAAASTLEQTGARLIDVVVPDADVSQSQLHFSMTLADMADVHREEMERDPERIGAEVLRRLKLGLDISGRDYSNSRRWLVEWRRKLWSLFREVDLLLTPTVPMVAPLRKDSADMIEITRAMARFTSGIGAAGMPSISLPCGFGEGGMPIGVQLVANSFGEALLFRAGIDFQQRTDFHLARPPLLREGCLALG